MLQILLCLLCVPFLIDAFRRSDIARCDSTDLAIWFALTILIFGALALTKNLPEGISLHYSGAAFLALTLGYSRALLSMSLLLLITQPLATIGQSILLDALLPIWLMVILARLSRRYLPANPFVFLLGCGFFGLFFVYAIQEVVGATAQGLVEGTGVLSVVLSDHTAWGLLLASGEATLEGMILSTLVAFYPKAVVLFDDAFYLADS